MRETGDQGMSSADHSTFSYTHSNPQSCQTRVSQHVRAHKEAGRDGRDKVGKSKNPIAPNRTTRDTHLRHTHLVLWSGKQLPQRTLVVKPGIVSHALDLMRNRVGWRNAATEAGESKGRARATAKVSVLKQQQQDFDVFDGRFTLSDYSGRNANGTASGSASGNGGGTCSSSTCSWTRMTRATSSG